MPDGKRRMVEYAGVRNVRVENAGPNCKGGKRETKIICGTKNYNTNELMTEHPVDVLRHRLCSKLDRKPL